MTMAFEPTITAGWIKIMDHMDALSRIEILEDALVEALNLIEGLMGTDARDSEVVLFCESVLESGAEDDES